MSILLTDGIDALTMRRLADSLDLTAGAIYRYFPGKGAILSSLGHRALTSLSEHMDREEARIRASNSTSLCAEDALHLVIARAWAYWDFCLKAPGTWRLINLMLVDPRRFIPEGQPHVEFMSLVFSQITCMAALLDGVAGVGAIRADEPGIARAMGVLATLNGSLHLTKLAETAPIAFDPSQTLRLLLDGLLRGWGADPSVLELVWSKVDTGQ
jgi:AcrR family transcriptional regulator